MIYQHEASGADQTITSAIGYYVQGEQRGGGLSHERLCLTFGLRREALLLRVEVRDLRLQPVAAGR